MKILRRLGSELGLPGFEQTSLAEVQAAMKSALDAAPAGHARPDPGFPAESAEPALYRIGEVAMYSVDSLCRRAAPLQQTAQAKNEFVALNPSDAERLGLADGAMARVTQGDAQIEVAVTLTGRVPAGGAWLRSATCVTQTLGPAVGPVTVEVA